MIIPPMLYQLETDSLKTAPYRGCPILRRFCEGWESTPSRTISDLDKEHSASRDLRHVFRVAGSSSSRSATERQLASPTQIGESGNRVIK